MATSLVSIVPVKDLCVSCSVHSDLRYYIVKKSGQKGPSYSVASEVYLTSFYCRENYGTYVCKDCYELLQAIVKTRNNLEELSCCLEENSQTLQSKRVINSTSNSNQNKTCLESSPFRTMLLSKYKEASPSSSQHSSKIPDAEMASQDSFKLPITKTIIKNARLIPQFVIKQRSAQKEHSISSSSTQQGNGDKSSSCDELCDSSIETVVSQEDSKSYTETTAVKSDEDGFTVIRWEGLTKTEFDDNTCVSKDKVISNTTVEKLENVILKQEISNSNTKDPKQNHPVNYQFIPTDRSNDGHETAESEVLNLTSRKQPVVVLERIKVEPDLMVSNIPEELGKNMQDGCSENIGNINLSQDNVAGTLLDVKTEECSIEFSEQGMFLRGLTEPYTSSGAQQETKQSEDETLASKVDSEDFVMRKQMEEEIQSVIQTNVEEMLISEQTIKGEGFTYSFPFACGLCNYTAKLQHHLKNHMKTHMSDRPFVCEICGKGFKHTHHLSGHKRTHSSERPYSCEHCGRGFTQISNMLRHQRTHQGVTERDQHKCYKCGKSFFTSYSLRRHSEMHENLKKKVKTIKSIKKKKLTYNPTVDDHQRKFECDVCGRKYTRKEHVMRHMLTHTGESMYTCEVCGKGYGSKKALERHINIHTGEDIEVDVTGSSSSSDSSGEDDMEDC